MAATEPIGDTIGCIRMQPVVFADLGVSAPGQEWVTDHREFSRLQCHRSDLCFLAWSHSHVACLSLSLFSSLSVSVSGSPVFSLSSLDLRPGYRHEFFSTMHTR